MPFGSSSYATQSRRTLLKGLGSLLVPSWALAMPLEPSILGGLSLELKHGHALKLKTFKLKNPDRVVVDLEGALLSEVKAGLAKLSVPLPEVITSIRAAQNTETTVRIVLDMAKPVELDIMLLKAGAGHVLTIRIPGTAEAAKPVSTSEPVPAPGQPSLVRSKHVIAIDAGHGGEDPGAIGPSGAYEKHITLKLAQLMREKLGALEDLEVVLTRDKDVFVPLNRRVAIAREARADVFISLHADAWTQPDVRGASVFTLSEKGASSSLAALLAVRENEVDRFKSSALASPDPQVAMTLLDLAQTATKHDSERLAKIVLNGLAETTVVRKPYVERAGFAVLKAPDVPSILIETAFISNPEEEMKLISSDFQDMLTSTLVKGVQRYLAPKKKLS